MRASFLGEPHLTRSSSTGADPILAFAHAIGTTLKFVVICALRPASLACRLGIPVVLVATRNISRIVYCFGQGHCKIPNASFLTPEAWKRAYVCYMDERDFLLMTHPQHMLRFPKPLRGPYTLLRIAYYFLWYCYRRCHSQVAELG